MNPFQGKKRREGESNGRREGTVGVFLIFLWLMLLAVGGLTLTGATPTMKLAA